MDTRLGCRLHFKQFSVPSVKVSCYCQCNISPCQVYIIELFVKMIEVIIRIAIMVNSVVTIFTIVNLFGFQSVRRERGYPLPYTMLIAEMI